MKKTIIFIVVMSIISCRPVLKLYYGIKQPGIETDASLAKVLLRCDADTSNSLHLDSVASYNYWRDRVDVLKLPNLELYNGSGELLRALQKGECSGTLAKALAELDLESMKPVIVKPLDLKKQLSYFDRSGKRNVNTTELKEGDYYVCIYYMKAMGKVSRDYIKLWTSQLKLNKSAGKIHILYMNIDMHESWGITGKDDDRYLEFD